MKYRRWFLTNHGEPIYFSTEKKDLEEMLKAWSGVNEHMKVEEKYISDV